MSKCDKCGEEIDIRRTKDGKTIYLNKYEHPFRVSEYGDEVGYLHGEIVTGYMVSESDENGYEYVRRKHIYDCRGEVR